MDAEREAKFWKRVIRSPDGCWLWGGYVRKDGYGQFWDGTKLPSGNQRMVLAHRLSLALARGPLDPALDVDHLCRVKHCVNPEHLDLVTTRTNVRRGLAMGPHPWSRGERNNTTKLTEEQVRSIRVDPRPDWDLAGVYGVHRNTIRNVKERKTWAWLT